MAMPTSHGRMCGYGRYEDYCSPPAENPPASNTQEPEKKSEPTLEEQLMADQAARINTIISTFKKGLAGMEGRISQKLVEIEFKVYVLDFKVSNLERESKSIAYRVGKLDEAICNHTQHGTRYSKSVIPEATGGRYEPILIWGGRRVNEDGRLDYGDGRLGPNIINGEVI